MHIHKKYKIKTYTQYSTKSIPYYEIEKNNFFINCNGYNNNKTEKNIILETTFQPKYIFSKENNNISFYQSTSKNSSYKNINDKNITTSVNKSNNNTNQLNHYAVNKFITNFRMNKRKSYEKTIPKEYINLEEVSQNNVNSHKRLKLPKYQFNIQKKDDFNMISNCPKEYNSDIKHNTDNLNPVYKMQEMEEKFFLSKRIYSPRESSFKNKNRYQTHSLKCQNFSGSFNCFKNSKMTKSTSRIKTNQLKDFNIDKLIEIGDKYANFGKPILSLGNEMNNNIMQYSNRRKNKCKIPINYKTTHYKYNEIRVDPEKEYQYSTQGKTSYIFKNVRMTKKILVKNKMKKGKTVINENMEESHNNHYKDSIKKILNFNGDAKDKSFKKNVKINKNCQKNKFEEVHCFPDMNDENKNWENIQSNKTNSKKKIIKKNSNKTFDLIINVTKEKKKNQKEISKEKPINDENNFLNSNFKKNCIKEVNN